MVGTSEPGNLALEGALLVQPRDQLPRDAGLSIPVPRYAAGGRLSVPLVLSRLRTKGAILFGSMAEPGAQQSEDLDGERVRSLRLRADGQRPLAVNLQETISLARKLFELRDAALRAR
jgi:hypothetical protein